ncbi:MAG: hypothetical protein P0111_06720 [Nitrospira sp.]|nr:hypothetical protein [Nitrospira sp.]
MTAATQREAILDARVLSIPTRLSGSGPCRKVPAGLVDVLKE